MIKRDGLSLLGAFGRTRGYVVLWLAALVFAIAAPVSSVWIIRDHRATPTWTPYGLTGDFHATVIWDVFGHEAKAAGIAPLDRIIAVDGVEVGDAGLGRMRELMRGSPGRAVTLTIRSPDGRVKQRQLHWQGANVAAGKATAGRQWEKGSLARLLPSAVQALLNVVAAILLFGRRRDPVAALLSIAMLCLNSYGLGERAFYELGLFKLQLVGAFTGFSLLLLGLFAFPAGRFVPRWTAAAAALVPWWAVFGFFFNDSQRGLIGFSFLGLLLLALAAIWLRYRGYASDAERQQVRWFMLGLAGTAVFTLLQLCCRFVIQTELDAATWLTNLSYLFALLATAAFSAGLVISLLKFRLYDADAVIERSVTFGVLTVGLLGIFAGSEKIIEVLGEEYFGDRLGALAGGLGAAVAAVMISPLHHRITDWAEHRFQRNLRRLRLQLPLIVGDLRETSRVERLAEVVLDELAIGLRSRCAALLVGDHVLAARGTEPDEVESWRRGWVKSDLVGPDCDPHDPHFALRLPLDAVGHGRVGWILLGPRPDGSFYGKDERETLGEIADPIARALDISAERDAERSATRAAMDELKERLSVLESRLSDLPAPAR